jgi:hypothetical protein
MRLRVLRSVVNSVLSLFVLATFLWGGCVSCEQFFMFPAKRQTCCNKSGQCERPGRNSSRPENTDCNRLPFERAAAAHALPLPAIQRASVAPSVTPFVTGLRVSVPEVLGDPSPPDIPTLHVTFLI